MRTAREEPKGAGAQPLLDEKQGMGLALSQALDLLAKLNENPYLVGIEEFRLKIDPKKRSEVELNITVSTFTKSALRTGRS